MNTGRQDQARSRKRLSFDTHDEPQQGDLIQQVLKAGGAIARAERQEIIRKGIIDERGDLLITELPEDMRKDAETEFGG